MRVARIFNTFGSRMHMNDGRVVSNFILQALQGEPLTVCVFSFSPPTLAVWQCELLKTDSKLHFYSAST